MLHVDERSRYVKLRQLLVIGSTPSSSTSVYDTFIYCSCVNFAAQRAAMSLLMSVFARLSRCNPLLTFCMMLTYTSMSMPASNMCDRSRHSSDENECVLNSDDTNAAYAY